MALPISDEAAKQFACALVSHGGNQSAAARACGYKPGNPARCAGRDLARNPAVLKYLQPMVIEHLSALTPRAIQTLAALLANKSGYIRLGAAKDILNRTGVGLQRNTDAHSAFSVHIQIGDQTLQLGRPVGGMETTTALLPPIDPGGRKTEVAEEARSPAHNFFPKVSPARVSEVLNLDVEPESIPGIENHGSVEDLDL
jgi:hypothetical protein